MNALAYQAYLQGALHDGTSSVLHRTHRICQKGTEWLLVLQGLLHDLGHKAWIYREGKQRSVYVVETTATFLSVTFDPDLLQSSQEQVAYVRGYFDAEGGLPLKEDARFYIQFTQKDQVELTKVRMLLEKHGIGCGKLHNPSVVRDPDYWRFFVRTGSHQRFVETIGSWHPRKQYVMAQRMKI